MLAQSADPALRPLLLQVQASSFAASPRRDREAVLRFEALALGLIPFSTSDILADVALTLQRLADPPIAVLKAIEERLTDILEGGVATGAPEVRRAALSQLSPSEILALAAEADDDVDLTLARNLAIRLDGAALDALVERGRTHRALASALHRRPEPTIYDRAALYRAGTRAERAQIRRTLRVTGVRPHLPCRPLDPEAMARLSEHAAEGAVHPFARLISDAAQIALPDPVLIQDEATAELIALALVALGIGQVDAVRMLLTLDPALSSSVDGFFSLADILRETPRGCATEILRCALPAGAAPRALADKREAPSTLRRAVGAFGPGQRADGRLNPTLAARPLQRRPGANEPDDRRWRATTNPDRT